jgi:two-component system cell cycle response regulator DivK
VESERRKSAPAEIGTALVVDAVKSQRAVAQVWLKRMGFRVTEAASGDEAAQALAKQPIDLVLLDLSDGAEKAMDRCRSLRQGKFFGIIIAVTAESDPGLESKAIEAGCNGFVTKPLTARNLQHAVENAMAEQPTAAAGGPVQSKLDQDEALRPLIIEFAGTLPKLIDELAAALASNEIEKVVARCKSIKADGGALGFSQITQTADAAIACLAGSSKLDDAQRQVSDLLHTLKRVSVSKGNESASQPAPAGHVKPKK